LFRPYTFVQLKDRTKQTFNNSL